MALNPKNTAFDLGNALALANASALAYDNNVTVDKATTAFGLPVTDLTSFRGAATDAAGFMVRMDGAIAIVFQGTDTLADWIDDADVLTLPFRDKGAVHSGFLLWLDSVLPLITDQLAKWRGGGRTLWIAGHSLGGALALLATASLRFPVNTGTATPVPVAGLYTFGQPRVGTRAFAQACDADFGQYNFRFVNNEDIVPRIPPRMLGYWHTQEVEFIDAAGAIHSDVAWWHAMLDAIDVGVTGFRVLQKAAPLPELIKDHAIALYVAKIQAAYAAGQAGV
jgi:triacylglycerol lipase